MLTDVNKKYEMFQEVLAVSLIQTCILYSVAHVGVTSLLWSQIPFLWRTVYFTAGLHLYCSSHLCRWAHWWRVLSRLRLDLNLNLSLDSCLLPHLFLVFIRCKHCRVLLFFGQLFALLVNLPRNLLLLCLQLRLQLLDLPLLLCLGLYYRSSNHQTSFFLLGKRYSVEETIVLNLDFHLWMALLEWPAVVFRKDCMLGIDCPKNAKQEGRRWRYLKNSVAGSLEGWMLNEGMVLVDCLDNYFGKFLLCWCWSYIEVFDLGNLG